MENDNYPSTQATFTNAKLEYISDVIVIHLIRIVIKLSIIAALLFSKTNYVIPLSIYLCLTEVFDQIMIYVAKIKPDFKFLTAIFYVLNSVLVISTITYFTGWVRNDFYLIYLIHISSVVLAYGWKIGIFSTILSISVYTSLLYINQVEAIYYLRPLLLSVLILRLTISRIRLEEITRSLENVLNTEKAKQDFISLASHNLRTPVTAIFGYIELLFRQETGKLNEDQTKYVTRIKYNNQELQKLTEELLQISILDIGKKADFLIYPSQIETVINSVMEDMSPMAEEKNLELIFQKPQNVLPLINMDVEKIKSVISNLVDNAIKYTEKGRVLISAQQEGDSISIYVQDTGIGINKNELPKIFSKFYRSGNVLVYNKVGIGLGLYLGKKIVELHGGNLKVESVEGKGSTFILTLPIAKEDILE